MRILVLNYEFPPIGGGGGHASAALCKELAARGHELIVLTSSGPALPKAEDRDGYRVQRVPTRRRSPYRATLITMASYVLAGLLPGRSLIRSWKPDVMHVHFAVPTGALGYALSVWTGIPYLLTAHLGDVPGGVPEKTDRWFRLVGPLTPPIWRRAAAIVAVSEFTRALAEERYGIPMAVIPNGLALPAAEDGPPDVGDPPVIVFAGRFQPQKNLLFLIETLAQLKDLGWRCVLMGDGPQWQEVARRVQALELDDRVTLTGWIDSEQVERQLRESDLLCMPSLSEGLPVIGVQALTHGLAIVANRAGGLVELVQDGVNGRLCEVGDAQCILNGLRWALADPDRLQGMKRASRERAHAYDIKHVATAYEGALAEAAGR
jgi:glycosyltransferase involved in cell wall biosynthesis